MSEVTEILEAIEQGDVSSTDRLLPIVYQELRRIAASKLSRESPGQTIQTTALVHEAYMRLIGPRRDPATDGNARESEEADGNSEVAWDSRGHFFAAAAESMRRILIDNARRKKLIKRGGGRQRVEFDHVQLAVSERAVDLLDLDDALAKLEAENESIAKVVKLRYFTGLTIEQTAKALGSSEATVKRHWLYARAWLRRQMRDEGEQDGNETD